jgi:hypothetical protein
MYNGNEWGAVPFLYKIAYLYYPTAIIPNSTTFPFRSIIIVTIFHSASRETPSIADNTLAGWVLLSTKKGYPLLSNVVDLSITVQKLYHPFGVLSAPNLLHFLE